MKAKSKKGIQINRKDRISYESILELERASNKHKVTISVSEPLIESLDDYAARAGTNRSAVVEEALFLWCKQQQDLADRDYYSNLTENDRKANTSWTKVTTEAAKHIWKK